MLNSGTNRIVTASKTRNFAIKAVAAIALTASACALAQVNTRVSSNISLLIDGGQQLAVVPLISETAQSDLMTYNFMTSEVQFSAGVLASQDYDEPLFCFDLGSPQSAASVEATDPNGHVIIDNFDLNLSLDYLLSASTLKVQTAINQQCFFRSGNTFGLFGLESPDASSDPDVISDDRFEPDLSLSLEFQGVPDFVTPGETVNYDLVVTNTGTADLQRVALQELFPENMDVYAAGLSAGTWSCTATGGATCPASGAGSLRVEEMNSGGIDISSNDSLTFSIERTVDSASTVGESIQLHAGTVTDPVVSDAPFAVDKALMTVIGQSAGLDVNSPGAQVSNDATIIVTVIDASQNPVPNETVTVSDNAGLSFTSPTSNSSGPNGEVEFTATTTSAGDYTVEFTSGTGTDMLTGSGLVSFDPGAPDELAVWAFSDNAVADNADTNVIKAYVEDAWGNAVPALTVDVLDKDNLTSLPDFASTDSSGTAIFSATSTDAISYSVEIGVSSLPSETVSLTFVPGNPADFAFMTQPGDTPQGGTMAEDITIRVVDEHGNWVTSDSSTDITLQLRQGGSQISTLANQTVQNGETTFTGLSMGNAPVGGGYYLRAFGTYGSNTTLLETSDDFEITTP